MTTCLVAKSSTEHIVYHFPFVYSIPFYGHFIDEKDFYFAVLKNLEKEVDVDLSSSEIIVSSYLHNVDMGVETAGTYSVHELLSASDSPSVLFSAGLRSFVLDKRLDDSLESFFSNLSICPHLAPSEYTSRAALGDLVVGSTLYPQIITEEILLTGDAVYTAFLDGYTASLFALDLIKESGLFKVSVDTQNIWAPLMALKLYNQDAFVDANTALDYLPFGTLLKTHGDVECLFTTDTNTSQLFEVEEGKLFVMPLGADSRAKVFIKNGAVGQKEDLIEGGSLGFVIDTRKDTSLRGAENWRKQIEESLGGF